MTAITTVTMNQTKVTKAFVRYDVPDTVKGPAVHNLYVRQDAFPTNKFPEVITVTVETNEDIGT